MQPDSEAETGSPHVTTWPASTPGALGAGPRRVFVVEGMDCAAEVRALEGELLPLLGGDRSRLVCDVLAARLTVTGSHSELADSAVLGAVSRAGLRAEPLNGSVSGLNRWSRSGRMVATTAGGLAIAVGITFHAVSAGSLLAPLGLSPSTAPVPIGAVVAFLLATAAGLVYVAPRALAALRALRGDMHLLMTVAVAGALGLGEYLEAASVSFLFSLSLLLESWSVARARRAVQSLLELSPPLARRRDEGGTETLLAPHELKVGELAVIHAGERIPLDGEVTEGVAHVDSSPLTGESTPMEAEPGSELFAGSVCLDGTLVIRVLRPAGDTLLARVVRRVTEARRHRARAEQWVDGFARVYTPAVFALAGLTALLPPLLNAGPWQEWFYRGLVLLVIGCPCALVISTPVSVVAGLTSAARHGVLVKGGDILELPARITAVAFDKTGTLTRGTLRVERILPLDGHTVQQVLGLAAGLNERSSHPVARALLDAARAAGIVPDGVGGVRLLPGRGAEGWHAGAPVWVGSSRLLQERGVEARKALELAEETARGGFTVVLVGKADHACGVIGLADSPRPEAAGAVASLANLGVGRITLLTGDNPEAAAAAGSAVGIQEVFARLLPEDKVRILERIRISQRLPGPPGTSGSSRGSLVAFVGDGVNDAPALAAADVGIAMGEGGADVALETADVALLRADLSRIPWLVRHSRRVVRVIRANIALALGIKALFVVLTATGFATLWAAIAADMGASLLVIANGLRLLGSPPPPASSPLQ